MKSTYFIIFTHEKWNFYEIILMAWKQQKYGKNQELLGGKILTEKQP